jgi:hypothetical protein
LKFYANFYDNLPKLVTMILDNFDHHLIVNKFLVPSNGEDDFPSSSNNGNHFGCYPNSECYLWLPLINDDDLIHIKQIQLFLVTIR